MNSARLAAVLLLAGCAPQAEPPLRVVVEPAAGSEARLRLLPGPGVRINALLKPALEHPDGRVFPLDAAGVTSDSAYFTEPPEALVPAPATGLVRASICRPEQAVCEQVVVGVGGLR